MVVAVVGFGLGQRAAGGFGKHLRPARDAARQRVVQVRQHLRTAVIQDAVDAEIQLGEVELEDVALEQAQEARLSGGCDGGGHGCAIVGYGRLARWALAAVASFSSKVASGHFRSAANHR